MKNILIAFICMLIVSNVMAKQSDSTAVAKAVQTLTNAMISGDKAALEAIVSDRLTYGHSGGHVEGKTEFVYKLTGGGSDFVTIDLTDQTILMAGKTAVVRHTLTANTNDNNKPAVVHLKIMLVFQKEKGQWKLLARQAVKVV